MVNMAVHFAFQSLDVLNLVKYGRYAKKQKTRLDNLFAVVYNGIGSEFCSCSDFYRGDDYGN